MSPPTQDPLLVAVRSMCSIRDEYEQAQRAGFDVSAPSMVRLREWMDRLLTVQQSVVAGHSAASALLSLEE